MISIREKSALKRASFNFFDEVLDDTQQFKSLKTKFNNVNSKTGAYNVPLPLFQKRTPRKNRVLLDWSSVKRNNLTMDHLRLFEGDVVVAFVNNDFFEEQEKEYLEIFNELKALLGSDDEVASMIVIKTEDGSPSSAVQREAHRKLLDVFPNYEDYLIKRKTIDLSRFPGIRNEYFEGFIYFDIRGGNQDYIYSHENISDPMLFNPASEYASTNVGLDIDLVLHFFALKSIEEYYRDSTYRELINDYKNVLGQIRYSAISEEESFDSLLEYCEGHPSLAIDIDIETHLYDPIQFEKIYLPDFSLKTSKELRNIHLSHNIPVNYEEFYYDEINNEILSASRPTNLFWSRHLSNMMQQNSTLNEYFVNQEALVVRRNRLLNLDTTR